ncbi:MAG: YhfC family glutamic-type intramembrane protease [Candidatus Promineifilaceae bacterium]
MIPALLTLNFLLMILLPLLLGRWIALRRQVSWRLFGVGALAFILSQAAHLPFNWLILQEWQWVDANSPVLYAVFLGLSAGGFEGVLRYITFRFWAKEARSWGTGLMVGAGHGGIEAILLGVLGILNFTILLGLREGYFQGILATVPPDQLYLVDEQISALFGVPASMALLGAVERVFALLLHLSASLLVMQLFVRGQWRWLAAGILWHAAIDGVLVYVLLGWGAITAEFVLGGMSVISLGIIFALRQPEPVPAEPEPLPELKPLKPIELSADSLERSKYSG